MTDYYYYLCHCSGGGGVASINKGNGYCSLHKSGVLLLYVMLVEEDNEEVGGRQ